MAVTTEVFDEFLAENNLARTVQAAVTQDLQTLTGRPVLVIVVIVDIEDIEDIEDDS